MFFLKRGKDKDSDNDNDKYSEYDEQDNAERETVEDSNKTENNGLEIFVDFFHTLMDTKEFPYNLAVESVENLHKSSKSKEDFFYYLLEDSIFASLYATFYEKLFITLIEEPSMTNSIIDNFSEQCDEREVLIAKHTHLHLQFIQNGGVCRGCVCCSNHKDVAALIPYWKNKDMDFLIELYVGMQAIQFTLENLLYDYIPTNFAIIPYLTEFNILEFRKYLFNFATQQLRN